MKAQVLPKGWTQERIQKLIAHYDSLTDAQWAAEDEAAFADPRMTAMLVPTELVPAIAGLIDARERKSSNSRARSSRSAKTRSKKSAKSAKR